MKRVSLLAGWNTRAVCPLAGHDWEATDSYGEESQARRGGQRARLALAIRRFQSSDFATIRQVPFVGAAFGSRGKQVPVVGGVVVWPGGFICSYWPGEG